MISGRWMTDEHHALHEMAYRFALEKGTPNLERWRAQQHIDKEFFAAAGELGLLGCSISEKCGGPGGTPADDFVVRTSSRTPGCRRSTPAPTSS